MPVLKIFPSKLHFELSDFYLGMLLLFCFLSSWLLLISIHFPFGLLYGPLLYCYIKSRSLKWFLVYCIPNILFQVLHIFLLTNHEALDATGYFLTGISFMVYGTLSLYGVSRSGSNTAREKLASQLAILFLLCSIFINVRGYEKRTSVYVGFDPEYLVAGILFFSCFIISRHLRHKWRGNSEHAEAAGPEMEKMAFNSANCRACLEGLKTLVEKEDVFLNSNLSLEKLALELKVPKHQLSSCLKVHLRTTFYEYIAEFRIKYAVRQLESGNSMTLESLAHECGFNSKTSFTKYFKECTGILPSEYRNRLQMAGKLKTT